jgi:hypothetical protein
LTRPLRTLRTLRGLTARQLSARALHELWLRTVKLAGPLQRRRYAPVPGTRGALLQLAAPEGAGLVRAREVAQLWRAGRVRYLSIDGDRDDWRGEGLPRLWRYERHYHAELISLAALSQREPQGPWLVEALGLVERWAAASPPTAGDGWEPYPVARRVLAWAEAMALAPALRDALAPLLLPQLRFVAAHLERHLLGNHLLCDASALVAGAAALEEPPARLAALGARVLVAELSRQVLPDGGFAERAALYHALVARDALLALVLARQRGLPLRIEATAARMLRWLGQVRRNGGQLPCLNDSTPGAAVVAHEALALGLQLELLDAEDVEADLQLPDTGWTLVREGRHELLFEHGPIGPGEQPGHGHADALSFELFWDGFEVITDSGISTYERGAAREYERSAHAHATVTVDGDGADEPWASFRVGGRGAVSCEPLQQDGPSRRLAARVRSWRGWLHERVLLFTPGASLRVQDRVSGARAGAEIVARFPLAPGFRFAAEPEFPIDAAPGSRPAEPASAVSASASAGRAPLLALRVLRGERLADEPGSVAAGFGKVLERPVALVRADTDGCIEVEIAPARGAP